MRRGVVIRTVINGFTFDGATKDPMQQAVRDPLIAFMAAIAQAQAEATKAAQRAGIEHAKRREERVYLGRKPSFTRAQLDHARALLAVVGTTAPQPRPLCRPALALKASPLLLIPERLNRLCA
jgi:hypothetical protein